VQRREHFSILQDVPAELYLRIANGPQSALAISTATLHREPGLALPILQLPDGELLATTVQQLCHNATSASRLNLSVNSETSAILVIYHLHRAKGLFALHGVLHSPVDSWQVLESVDSHRRAAFRGVALTGGSSQELIEAVLARHPAVVAQLNAFILVEHGGSRFEGVKLRFKPNLTPELVEEFINAKICRVRDACAVHNVQLRAKALLADAPAWLKTTMAALYEQRAACILNLFDPNQLVAQVSAGKVGIIG
jgi:hypothetical protein